MIIPSSEEPADAQAQAGTRRGRRPPGHQGNFNGPLDFETRTFRTQYMFGSTASPSFLALSSNIYADPNLPLNADEDEEPPTASLPTTPLKLVEIWPHQSVPLGRLNVLVPPPSVALSVAGTERESLAPSISYMKYHSVQTMLDIFEPVRVFNPSHIQQRFDSASTALTGSSSFCTPQALPTPPPQ